MEEEKSFAAFLRGINISGKNKIPMTELKKGFEKLGLEGVKTYLNSGNVVFSSEELEDILQHAPDWWAMKIKTSMITLFLSCRRLHLRMCSVRSGSRKKAWRGSWITKTPSSGPLCERITKRQTGGPKRQALTLPEN